jgi:hypothetical protein
MLRTHERAMLGGRKSISLWSACEQFFRNATRTTDDDPVRGNRGQATHQAAVAVVPCRDTASSSPWKLCCNY